MKTCPHCSYEWTPRKENPKKCPQCQNPLWTSAKPKRRKPVDAVKYFEDGEAVFILPAGVGFPVREGSSSVVERPSVKILDEQSDGKAEGGSSVRIPASPPSISDAKARAEELLRMLG